MIVTPCALAGWAGDEAWKREQFNPVQRVNKMK